MYKQHSPVWVTLTCIGSIYLYKQHSPVQVTLTFTGSIHLYKQHSPVQVPLTCASTLLYKFHSPVQVALTCASTLLYKFHSPVQVPLTCASTLLYKFHSPVQVPLTCASTLLYKFHSPVQVALTCTCYTHLYTGQSKEPLYERVFKWRRNICIGITVCICSNGVYIDEKENAQSWKNMLYVTYAKFSCCQRFIFIRWSVVYIVVVLMFYPGAIYTTRQLVFNANQPAVHLVVTATDHGTPVRQSTAITVQITVEDINDHAPVFTLASYRSYSTLFL